MMEKYQSHRHTFTCKKKGKVIRIQANEGHGKLDGQIEGDVILSPVCRPVEATSIRNKATDSLYVNRGKVDLAVRNKSPI